MHTTVQHTDKCAYDSLAYRQYARKAYYPPLDLEIRYLPVHLEIYYLPIHLELYT